MSERLNGVVTVLLPGTGSDDEYLHRAFGEPLRECGARPVPVRPRPKGLLTGYLQALEDAAAAGPIAIGGVSLGAAVAAAWALQHPDRTVAVLAALPPWTGAPGTAPAAVSARHTAAELRRRGLAAVTEEMRTSSPDWLGTELARSWLRQWPAPGKRPRLSALRATSYTPPFPLLLSRKGVEYVLMCHSSARDFNGLH